MTEKQKILIVDDKKENLVALRLVLGDLDADVVEATTGNEALAATLEHDFAVAILDVMMPGMDGYELAEHLRGDKNTRGIPIVFVTAALSDELHMFKGYEAGGIDYITKPYPPEVMVGKVNVLLEMNRNRRELQRHRDELEAQVAQRTKEIKCLQTISSLVAESRETVEETLEAAVELIQPGWRYPEIICARVVFQNKEFVTANFKETPWRQSASIDISGQAVGRVDVFYLEEKPEAHEGPFLREERELIADIARQLGVMIQRKQSEKAQEEIQAQLAQAQKMESVGRLAGGVAHDFNNILTVIQGFSELIKDSLDPNDPMRNGVEEIQKAADSAASLTSQLLAFSRKQIVAPRTVNINEAVDQSQKMLGRLIGEDINLIFSPDKNLGQIKIDPEQINQILVNLAVNARDAMPDGGRLTIETQNVKLETERSFVRKEDISGDFVLLAISDNGCGIPADKIDSIFEPFFTTKEKGKGTGLGLSTVYGIVKQNSGYINIYSEPDQGTTFKIYLPRVDEEARQVVEIDEKDDYSGKETILLVEDQEVVRKLAQKVLERYGYKVLPADDGGDALLTCEQYEGTIDLILTDVVMPKMSGKEFYKRISEVKPGMKVIYMSGYTENAIAHHGVLEEGTNFIPKPFRPKNLAKKVRQVLDTPAPEKTSPQQKTSLKGSTVLVIDDEENIRIVVSEFLDAADCKILLAENAKEGLAMLKKHLSHVDAILLDETLPDRLGHALLEDIRNMSPEVPVILTSGHGPDEIMEAIKNFENVSFMQKPFSQKDLLSPVENALGKKG